MSGKLTLLTKGVYQYVGDDGVRGIVEFSPSGEIIRFTLDGAADVAGHMGTVDGVIGVAKDASNSITEKTVINALKFSLSTAAGAITGGGWKFRDRIGF